MKFLCKILLTMCFALLLCSTHAQKSVKNYIQKYRELAVYQMNRYDIPASIILGVSIVESAAGQSILARIFNNYFGIKGSNTDSHKKLGYKSAYREYRSDTASYDHFCAVLMNKNFYSQLKGEKDYKEWLRQMNRCNYATAKGEWVNKILAAISKYKLYEYDQACK